MKEDLRTRPARTETAIARRLRWATTHSSISGSACNRPRTRRLSLSERDATSAHPFHRADEIIVPAKSGKQNQGRLFGAGLTVVCRRRTATGVRTAGMRKCRHPLERGSGSARELTVKICRHSRERMRRHQHRESGSVIERASQRSGKARRRIDAAACPHGHDLRVHRAAVRPVPAAARWQARVRAAVDQGRQWPEPEKQHEKNGEAAPHLKLMLADTQHRGAASDKKVTMSHSPLRDNRRKRITVR